MYTQAGLWQEQCGVPEALLWFVKAEIWKILLWSTEGQLIVGEVASPGSYGKSDYGK